MSTKERLPTDDTWDVESPFLDEELFVGESEEEWEPRATALAAESPFRSAFEQGRGSFDSPEMEGPRSFDEEPFSEGETGVINGENRVRITPTVGVPWRWICKIEVKGNRDAQPGGGTGVLVSNRHVLTAAHVVHEASQNMQNFSIQVIPALDYGDELFGSYSVSAKPKLPRNYRPDGENRLDWDYALLKLNTAVGKETFRKLKGNALCFWGSPQCGSNSVFARPDPATLNGKAVFTAGYPRSKGAKKLMCAAGILHSVNRLRRTMWMTADATPGQSGSPVWIDENGRFCLVGVATAAGANANAVVRVTRELVRQVREWITQDGETPSMIETEEMLESPAVLLSYPEAEHDEPPVAEWSPEATTEEAEDFTSTDGGEDELELLHEQPLEERFDPSAIPNDVADALGKEDWPLALKLAIQAGWCDENELTNLVFFARHPELPPETLDPKGPKFAQLSAKWTGILNKDVWKAIQVSAKNTDLVVSGEEVTDHHRFFWGKSGKRLKQLVENAAREVDLNPGLLGAIMMAETRRPQSYLSSGKVRSYHIGADDFYEGRDAIKARVPAYAKVKWDKNQTPDVHDNDARKPRKVKTILFDSGPDAVLATAVYVKFREVRLREIAAELNGDFDNLPIATRFALARMAMAAGTGGATPFLKDALKGVDIFIRKDIPVRAYQTQRNATVRTAQAMHLSDWIFGNKLPPATQPEIEESEGWDKEQEGRYDLDSDLEGESGEDAEDLEFEDAWAEGEADNYASDLDLEHFGVLEFPVRANHPAGSGGMGSVKPLGHMAFDHILLESLDPATSAMVPGVVPASPAALTTPFFDASVAGTIPDPTLQKALTKLINSKPAYKNAGKNVAVSLVDLSGTNKLSPKYAGFNDLTNFYGGSVNKITGLLGVYQLLAEANELLKAKPTISDVVGVESDLKILWTQAGIAAKHHPQVAMILTVQPGSPSTAVLRPELVARLDRISKANQNGSTPIVLLKFPFVGSTMLAHGLFSPTNNGGLWTRKAYGKVSYLGQKISLPNWSTKENPHPKTEFHNINAVSLAQFYTLAAQRRMIDDATSKAVLRHLQSGGCTTVIDVTALSASGQVSTKCGIFPLDGKWTHNAVHFKETATLREFVVVILTKNHTFGIMKNLFKDLVALVP